MYRFLALGLLILAAGCVPSARPPEPAPLPTPVAAVPPFAAVTPSPYAGDWRDWPITPGGWVYRQDGRGSIALFGPAGADADLTIRCDREQNRIYLSRRGAAPGNVAMTVRTSTLLRPLTAQPTGGTPAYMASALDPRDGVLDAMGFSRGRFIIEMSPMSPLVVPAWAEVLRVIEDCRR